ncbi:MAG: chemotaxis protein CheB [Bacteroidota bacterium]
MTANNASFFVVGIGASAGGLDAIQKLFDHLPDDTGMAFVIIQHLSPDFKSLMPELLSKHTEMPIYKARDKQIIKPNCIYLNQRSKNLHLKGNKLLLLDKAPKHNLNLPIDIFFHTLGEEYKENAVGIILSGTGSDGSRGIKTIKEQGGTIIVQNPKTCQFDGMPNSALMTNTVDHVLELKEMAQVLTSFPDGKSLLVENYIKERSNDDMVKETLTIIYTFCNIDFREYKRNTILRRLEKRMQINNIEYLSNYISFLSGNDEEKNALKDDFLIGVTKFFRDSEGFEALKKEVIPAICKSKSQGDTARVWIPGCSTGEEAYSIAILIDDYIRINRLNIDFKIFATDIDSRALAIAGLGQYDVNAIDEIEKGYLEHYFIKSNEKITASKRLREKIVFSNHNLICDPPFIKLDLISCRNLLIYLENKIQKKALFNFQFALNKFSFLFLGNSESLGEISKYFKTINTKWKIFQNISDNKILQSQYTLTNRTDTLNYATPSQLPSDRQLVIKESSETIFHKFLSKKYSPSTILIDRDYNILYISGNAGKKLFHAEGVFQRNLLKVVSAEISSIIRSGIRRLEAEGKDVVIKQISTETFDDEMSYVFDLTFHKPHIKEISDCYLLEFGEDKKIEDDSIFEINRINIEEFAGQRLEDLESELKETKTKLQNTVEQLENSNAELQSSNEELMASNEELQSTNEELQSVNEELYTVNSEMQEKNKELTNLSNDVSNLMDNTQIATLFLDTDLRIRKFTPALKKVFNLLEEDLGRPLSSFTSNFSEVTRSTIIKDVKKVLKKFITIEKQLNDDNGNFYLERISPFITNDKTVQGVVITFDNINKLKEIEEELEIAETRYKNLFENLSNGLLHARIIVDKKGVPIDYEYIDVNPAYEQQIGLKNSELTGQRMSDVLPYINEDSSIWMPNFGETALTGKEQNIEDYVSKTGNHYIIRLFSPAKNEFAASFVNISELKQKTIELVKSENELKRIQSITHVGSWYFDIATNEVTWTEELYKIYGFDPALPVPDYTEQDKLFTKDSWKLLSQAVDEATKNGTPYEIELNIIRDNGEFGWLRSRGEAVFDDNNNVYALRGAAQDITKQKLTEQAITKAKREAELANMHKNNFLANMSHEIRTPMNGVLGFSQLLKNDDLPREERLKYLEIIDGNSKQLLNLIDDIIDVSKIEANEIKISKTQCNITSLMRNLEISYNQLKIAKNKEHIIFKPVIPEQNSDLLVVTDCSRLEQVMSNLLNNSLKFSNKGTISFGYEIEDDNLAFFVQDEGIGIQKSKQAEIFDRFKQINYEKNAKYGGTGLGLAICKGIVTLLGGEITVSSRLHKGTRFDFYIPLKTNDKIKKKNVVKTPKDASFLKGKKILIAEDDSLIQLLFKVVMKKSGAELIFANNGKKALKSYKKNPDIDIVLLDIRMPEMNGIDALEEILNVNPDAKVIMQSAYVMADEKERCYEKGCADFLPKPVVKSTLFETLYKWLN